jgi:formylglycine-generating enzyme required for sulfatase activity
MAGKIFVNYRRGDDEAFAGRLFDSLREAFKPEQLFMDVDGISPGLDFVRVLEEQVTRSDVVLVVIGKGWIEARDAIGRRLDDPKDFVRIEIATALNQDKRVIPVLIGEARMPSADELPEAIRPLARRNAVRLTHDRFRTDTQALITALQKPLEEIDTPPAVPPIWPPSRPTLMVASLVGVAVLGAIAVWSLKAPTPPIPPAGAPRAPLPPEQERRIKPNSTFIECSNCPQMMVVPAGSFTMGSPAGEPGRSDNEGPQHTVTFARQFAVGQFELTFDDWDACVADGGCNGYKPSDQGWGRGRRPVINVSWDDAKRYVDWLSNKTGKTYRLLSEAEYEYATRAGTQTAYPWGNDNIGKNNANCRRCGSQWDGKQTAPVGSFAANAFGLYDMVGNVWAWTEDCLHDDYSRAPADGTAWNFGDCGRRIIRGGSFSANPPFLRSADRDRFTTGTRRERLGFRVGRTLLPP